MGSVEVNILGQKYTIRGEENEDYIASLANYLNNRISEICNNAPNVHPLKAAILSGLGVADEVFKLKEEIRIINKRYEQVKKELGDSDDIKKIKSDYSKLKEEYDRMAILYENTKDYYTIRAELERLRVENDKMAKELAVTGQYYKVKDELERLKEGYDMLTKELEATTDALNNILG
ncbi:MAG: cell division protein ZapA [Candidatus Magnetoovum sp. WYHC-5]|nr:cell division protein ZapA [Candidatus Magnetoovum sp. WYHC-5]